MSDEPDPERQPRGVEWAFRALAGLVILIGAIVGLFVFVGFLGRVLG